MQVLLHRQMHQRAIRATGDDHAQLVAQRQPLLQHTGHAAEAVPGGCQLGGRGDDAAVVDRPQPLDVVELDAAWPQRHPVVRRACHDHRLGVAREHEARYAKLAGLREHVGR